MSNNKIKILPENLANKIAAGEVVQRPESVVKELLENSIDAGSDNITLVIKRAGKVLIQVFDNGSGMDEEDAILCIQKHATSKISELEDLDSIKTLGFRGEALSSIAAVSQLEIRTETFEQEIGTLLRFDDSGNIVKEKGSYPKGTSVSVKNLFYNVPARRNFLKSDATELKHIIDTFNRIALSRPAVSFKLYNDDEIICNYPSGTLEDRISQVFADNMIDALVPVSEKTEFLNIHGYVGKPSLLKKSKGEQHLFLNNRYVISKQINHAVFTAYENILEKGDYPFFVLFVELDPARIDVNVHPSKLEVRFEDERDIYNFILAVIRKSLGVHDLVPSMIFSGNEIGGNDKIAFNPFSRSEKNDFSDRPVFSNRDIDLIFNAIPDEVQQIRNSSSESVPDPFEFEERQQELLHHTSTEHQKINADEVSFIVQLHNKYILSQIKSGLIIIDQHVAHERILYEKALTRFETNLPFSQQLLFPKTLELDPAKYILLKELNSYLLKLGFTLKFFSRNTVIIDGVPDDVKSGTEEMILLEMIDEYIFNHKEKKLETRDNIAKSYSCKTAIKAGDKLNEKEIRLLIDQLFATSMPYVCPHGRPIVIKISLDEFDRRFGRTS